MRTRIYVVFCDCFEQQNIKIKYQDRKIKYGKERKGLSLDLQPGAINIGISPFFLPSLPAVLGVCTLSK